MEVCLGLEAAVVLAGGDVCAAIFILSSYCCFKNSTLADGPPHTHSSNWNNSHFSVQHTLWCMQNRAQGKLCYSLRDISTFIVVDTIV